MTLLEGIQSPADVRKLPAEKLPALAQEIRQRIIDVVSNGGGHLASNLGVTELTIALHRVFDFSTDRLLFDVGHQCYPHKLLTGRADRFDTVRKEGGLSGFPNTAESEYDLFNVGHAGTAIATAVGMARGDALLKRDTRVVALVGDASIVNGVAFEGLNQAGTLKRQMLVILNDNSWGISPTQGGLAEHLARFRSSKTYEEIKERAKTLLPNIPVVGKALFDAVDHLKEGIKATMSPNQIFEPLGFQYIGPVDGHDIGHLIELLDLIKDVNHPVLLHVHTVKGRGCEWAAAEPGVFHSPSGVEVQAGKVTVKQGTGKSWTNAFADALTTLANDNPKIVGLTAAMPDGTGMNKFQKAFPERYFDCGIAESCTVDIAAGLARSGMRPVVAIYSTFLQRAFDQVFQEVSLQELPVVFCLDRAGLVGGDGAVHHGFLDIAYLRGFPEMVLMAPADEPELNAALRFALTLPNAAAIRYPRDKVPTEPLPDCPPFELGCARTLRSGSDATILAYGVMTAKALDAADLLAEAGVEVTVVNARFAKPIDRRMVRDALAGGRPVITVEDHSVQGGFGAAVLETAQEMGLSAAHLTRLGLPDRFIEHGSRAGQLAEAGIDATGIAAAMQALIDRCGKGEGDASTDKAEAADSKSRAVASESSYLTRS
ncbi:MAG: 1-deoxy-D-xylulose-5-phosphate synthase [Phycisphaerales bacterium]|nr:1-deoxy-D-xylulose-5-phosphate synthase [Phycisphaerales bacterium]